MAHVHVQDPDKNTMLGHISTSAGPVKVSIGTNGRIDVYGFPLAVKAYLVEVQGYTPQAAAALVK